MLRASIGVCRKNECVKRTWRAESLEVGQCIAAIVLEEVAVIAKGAARERVEAVC